jgi:hypothetical protein
MSNNTAVTQTTNIVPVQGVFAPEPSFALQYFVGPAGTPFYGPENATFTNIATITGTIATTPVGDTDIANKGYVDSVAQGLDVKASCVYSTTADITLSGLAVQAGGDWTSTLTAGDRILVKNQASSQFNGIYVASSTAWARSADMNTWAEVPSAFTFIESGTTLADTGWVSTANQGGTINVTPMPWSQFSGAGSYLAGTGLTLTGNTFSITNTAVTAAAYGSSSQVATFTVNAQGQLTLAASTSISIAATQVTSGTIDSARLSGSYSGITGLGTLGDLTVTNTISGSISGNAATATTATKSTNLAGGATGSLPYQSAADTTAFLAAGTNGQVLSLTGGIPAWINASSGTVTSVSGTGTVSGITLSGTVTTTGSLTLGGTLDLSSPPTIGNTTPNTGKFTTLTVNDNTTLGTSNSDTINFVGRINSDFDPATDNTYDLGRVGHEWRDLYIDGTANIDSLIADTADINAGTIDNTTIGATTPQNGSFVDLSVTGTTSFDGAQGTSGQVLTSAGTGNTPTWTTPTTGTVTAVSVVSANGFAGTSSGGATPALTLTTTITGLLKGNGTAISAAVANTDYMGVGAPVTKTADFTVANGEIWYINNKSGSTCTVTLPAASSWTGRTLTFKNMQAQTLVSASSNVVPIDSTVAGTAILLAVVGNWATMVSDGTNWVIMQQAANNCLLLE